MVFVPVKVRKTWMKQSQATGMEERIIMLESSGSPVSFSEHFKAPSFRTHNVSPGGPNNVLKYEQGIHCSSHSRQGDVGKFSR